MARHGVYDAFELRAELINYKKALYHLYLEAMAVEKDLRQLSALLHCSLTSPPSDIMRPSQAVPTSACVHADASQAGCVDVTLPGTRGVECNGEQGEEATASAIRRTRNLTSQRDQYVHLSEALMACKGTVLALQVTRSVKLGMTDAARENRC